MEKESTVSDAPASAAQPTVQPAHAPPVTGASSSSSSAGDAKTQQGAAPTEYDEEEFEVCLTRMSPWASNVDVSNVLKLMGVTFKRVQKRKGKTNCFVLFESDAEVEAAIPLLEKHCNDPEIIAKCSSKLTARNKKQLFRVNRRDPKREQRRRQRRAMRKRSRTTNANGNLKKPRTDKEEKKEEPLKTIAEKIVPLAHLPYEEQLAYKHKEMIKVLKKASRNLHKQLKTESFYTGPRNMLCELADVIKTPQIERYRNKTEMTIGFNGKGAPTVGFVAAGHKRGFVIEPPVGCRNIHTRDLAIGELVAEWIQTSGLKPYDPMSCEGIFRRLLVRTAQDGAEVMVGVQLNPTPLSAEEHGKLKTSFAKFVVERMVDDAEFRQKHSCNVVCATWQCYTGVSNAAPPTCEVEVLFGSGFITECVLGKRFRISHNSFFQVNTKGAEVLYKTIMDQVECSKPTTLLDVCCGTGTIGICMASKVEKVVGVEVVSAAVEDAKANAKSNGVDNIRFVCGKAEDTLAEVAKQEARGQRHLVAIVDPPRPGLHNNTIKALRQTQAISRIVYVACNPNSVANSIKNLIRPAKRRTWTTPPFRVVKAIPVDMFPLTDHTELIVVLDRMSEAESDAFVRHVQDEAETIQAKRLEMLQKRKEKRERKKRERQQKQQEEKYNKRTRTDPPNNDTPAATTIGSGNGDDVTMTAAPGASIDSGTANRTANIAATGNVAAAQAASDDVEMGDALTAPAATTTEAQPNA